MNPLPCAVTLAFLGQKKQTWVCGMGFRVYPMCWAHPASFGSSLSPLGFGRCLLVLLWPCCRSGGLWRSS